MEHPLRKRTKSVSPEFVAPAPREPAGKVTPARPKARGPKLTPRAPTPKPKPPAPLPTLPKVDLADTTPADASRISSYEADTRAKKRKYASEEATLAPLAPESAADRAAREARYAFVGPAEREQKRRLAEAPPESPSQRSERKREAYAKDVAAQRVQPQPARPRPTAPRLGGQYQGEAARRGRDAMMRGKRAQMPTGPVGLSSAEKTAELARQIRERSKAGAAERRARQIAALEKRKVSGVRSTAELAARQQSRVAGFQAAGAREREKAAAATRRQEEEREAHLQQLLAQPRQKPKPMKLRRDPPGPPPGQPADVSYNPATLAKLREHRILRKHRAPWEDLQGKMPTAEDMHAASRGGRQRFARAAVQPGPATTPATFQGTPVHVLDYQGGTAEEMKTAPRAAEPLSAAQQEQLAGGAPAQPPMPAGVVQLKPRVLPAYMPAPAATAAPPAPMMHKSKAYKARARKQASLANLQEEFDAPIIRHTPAPDSERAKMLAAGLEAADLAKDQRERTKLMAEGAQAGRLAQQQKLDQTSKEEVAQLEKEFAPGPPPTRVGPRRSASERSEQTLPAPKTVRRNAVREQSPERPMGTSRQAFEDPEAAKKDVAQTFRPQLPAADPPFRVGQLETPKPKPPPPVSTLQLAGISGSRPSAPILKRATHTAVMQRPQPAPGPPPTKLGATNRRVEDAGRTEVRGGRTGA